MVKLFASIKKELIILLSDKIGLIVLFVMPLLLVFIITIIQDSAYQIINEKKISMMVSNQDKGILGDVLIENLTQSGFFNIEQDNDLDSQSLELKLISDNILTALYIPTDFSQQLDRKATHTSSKMMSQLGVLEYDSKKQLEVIKLNLYKDPILQESFSTSISQMLQSALAVLENKLMIQSVYKIMDQEIDSETIVEQMSNGKSAIITHVASHSKNEITPNSTQHNVPAWTLFAMFFMVVSLGGNIVKERMSGSFMRLKTMPSNFATVLTGKMLVFFTLAILQIIVIFGFSLVFFPLLDLPTLVFPDSKGALAALMTLSSMAAVSFSLMIGTLTKSTEQCIGIGAVSVIIFGAIGGIWVPIFVMPHYMQQIAMISPLHWCLEGFYILFLKGGSWMEMLPIIAYIVVFVSICQAITIIKLRSEKLI